MECMQQWKPAISLPHCALFYETILYSLDFKIQLQDC